MDTDKSRYRCRDGRVAQDIPDGKSRKLVILFSIRVVWSAAALEQRVARKGLNAEDAHVALLDRIEETVFRSDLALGGIRKQNDFNLRKVFYHHFQPRMVVRRDADESRFALLLGFLERFDKFAGCVERVSAAGLMTGDAPQIGVFLIRRL